MKTKTSKMNALFGAMMAIFAVLFFSMLPAPSAQAGGPSKKPGLTIKKTSADSAEAIRQAETLKIFEADTTAQPPADVPPAGGGGAVDLPWLLTQENAIASLLMLLLTFLSKWLPFVSKIGDTGKRALVVGLTVIAGFVVGKMIQGDGFTFQGFASLGITYLLTTLGYDKGLKPWGIQTPKAAGPRA
jgi:hypothetical protein